MFARTGAQAARNVLDAAEATQQNSWDPNKLIKESMAARSKEKKAAMEAERYVRENKLTLEGIEAVAKRDAKISKAEYDIAKTNRKAGVISAIAQAGAADIAEAKKPDPPKPYQYSDTPYQTFLDSKIKQLEEIQQRQRQLQERGPDYAEQIGQPVSNPDTTTKSSASTTPISSGGPTTPINSGGKVTQKAVYQGLIERGLDEQNARIGAAVMMGESGGRAGIDTVQSGTDPYKTNEFSVGLMQINTKAHMDKLTRRGMTIDDLRDPNKNLDIAVEVYREAGNSWRPWGAYTNKSYTDFMNF